MREIPAHVDVLIIGGGASGVAAAAALKRKHPRLSLVIAEKSPHVGLGIAYSTESAHHILNVPVKVMGLYHDDGEHFMRWCAEKNLGFSAEDFVSRLIYGQYLQEILFNQIIPDVWPSEVISIAREKNYFLARGADGRVVHANNVVLALGHTPLLVPVRRIEGELDGRFIANPWAAEGYENLESVKKVAIFGSGLTAMDVAGALEKEGFKGTMVLYSRRGLLPFASSDHLQRVEVAYSAALLPHGLRPLVRFMRSAIKDSIAQGKDWRAVIDGVRPHIPALFRELSEFEHGQFMRHVRAYWDVARHRMPKEVRERVEQLRREGRVLINRGRLEELDFKSNANSVTVVWRRGAERFREQFDRIYNCAGSEALKPEQLPPLIQSLKDQGLIDLHPQGLGINCKESGEVAPGCFLIGPLRRASEWESTAMREIRQQAFAVAEQITT